MPRKILCQCGKRLIIPQGFRAPHAKCPNCGSKVLIEEREADESENRGPLHFEPVTDSSEFNIEQFLQSESSLSFTPTSDDYSNIEEQDHTQELGVAAPPRRDSSPDLNLNTNLDHIFSHRLISLRRFLCYIDRPESQLRLFSSIWQAGNITLAFIFLAGWTYAWPSFRGMSFLDVFETVFIRLYYLVAAFYFFQVPILRAYELGQLRVRRFAVVPAIAHFVSGIAESIAVSILLVGPHILLGALRAGFVFLPLFPHSWFIQFEFFQFLVNSYGVLVYVPSVAISIAVTASAIYLSGRYCAEAILCFFSMANDISVLCSQSTEAPQVNRSQR